MLKLLGLLLPPVIDLINRKVHDSDLRFWISVLFCAIVGIFIKYVETQGFVGYGTPLALVEDVSESILVVFGLAQIAYKAGYEDSRLQDSIRS